MWSSFVSCGVSTRFSSLQSWDGQKLLVDTGSLQVRGPGRLRDIAEGSCVEGEPSPWLPETQRLVATKWANSGIM